MISAQVNIVLIRLSEESIASRTLQALENVNAWNCRQTKRFRQPREHTTPLHGQKEHVRIATKGVNGLKMLDECMEGVSGVAGLAHCNRRRNID